MDHCMLVGLTVRRTNLSMTRTSKAVTRGNPPIRWYSSNWYEHLPFLSFCVFDIRLIPRTQRSCSMVMSATRSSTKKSNSSMISNPSRCPTLASSPSTELAPVPMRRTKLPSGTASSPPSHIPGNALPIIVQESPWPCERRICSMAGNHNE